MAVSVFSASWKKHKDTTHFKVLCMVPDCMSVHEFFRERTADFAYMYVSYLLVTFTVASRHAPCAVKWLVVGDLVKVRQRQGMMQHQLQVHSC